MNNLLLSAILSGMLFNPINALQDMTIQLMKGIDQIGYTLNIPTIEAIDGLNQLWYDLEGLKED